MPDIYDWSSTADDNDNADSDINWQEGQDPGTVNNSSRVGMKRVRDFVSDLSAAGTVGGTADAITLTSTIASLASNKLVAFKAASSNTGATTLAVNSLTAKAIRKMSGGSDVALVANDIKAGRRYLVVYDAAANSAAGAWILVTPIPSLATGEYLTGADIAANSGIYFEKTGGPAIDTIEARIAGTPYLYVDVNRVGVASTELNLTGGNIRFPATQVPSADANVLDDYEEGSWTPADGSGAGLSLTSATGRYVKIGKLVSFVGNFTFPTTVDASNALISGLPFTAENVGTFGGGSLTYRTISGVAHAAVVSNSATLGLYSNVGANVTNATCSTGVFCVSGVYRATA